MDIPYNQLSESALLGVIEEFILREGTDYGQQEYSLQDKIDQIKAQLVNGQIKLTFDPDTETCNLERIEGWVLE